MSRSRKKAAVGAAACVFVGGWEGVQTVAYPDPATRGHPWTICYGETSGVKKGDRRSIEECRAGLAKGLDHYGDQMERCLAVPISDDQWIAFVSFSWNLGPGRFCSKIAPLVNTGRMKDACDKLLDYDRAAGIRMRGLTRRREAEHELCMRGLA